MSRKAIYQALKKTPLRDLPWRRDTDPYLVLVSEIMLQQTQVDRVVPFYLEFVRRFPSAQALSKATLRQVLEVWQGLGYNRRAKFLHDAAKYITRHGWPKNLEELPGVGHYTARAVECFAFNKPAAFIETNIRTVLFYHLQNTAHRSLSDAQLLPMVEKLLKESKMPPREFYWRMMDYGAVLKRQGVRLNAVSVHYKKQSKFEGSSRQRRAAKLRVLLRRGVGDAHLAKALAQ